MLSEFEVKQISDWLSNKEVYAALDQVKGIGPKVMDRIRAALDPLFQED